MSLTLDQIRSDLYGKVEIRDTSEASSLYQDDVLRSINWALQVMWLSPHDHFKEEQSYSIALLEGIGSYVLDQDVQRVLGNARLSDGTTLAPVLTRSDFDNYGIFYLGLSDNDIPNGKPVSYYVNRYRNTGDDLTTASIDIVPKPDGAYTMFVDVERECPRYSSFGSTVVPVPHKYCETIFLPLARYAMTRSEAFRNNELYSRLEADYQQALAFLGISDPQIPQVSERDNK
jgi:hypothetical protein